MPDINGGQNNALLLYAIHILGQISSKYLHPQVILPGGCMDLEETTWGFVDKIKLEKSYSFLAQNFPEISDFFAKNREFLVQIAMKNINDCMNNNVSIIAFNSRFYPDSLRHINDPPPVIFAKGSISLLCEKKYAIIGSRKANRKAICESVNMGKLFADFGIVCVSGGAFGADIASHYGVLSSSKNPCKAIVVFAGGLKNLHPRGNSHIFSELFARGALFISERLWDSKASPWHFPVRNRIISGLSARIFVMQAGLKSGALTTALAALNQGRDIFTLLHDPQDPDCQGSAYLLEEGSPGFIDAKDFIQKEGL